MADFHDTGDPMKPEQEHETMTDKHGYPVTVGALCRFYSKEHKAWLPGSVRVIGQSPAFMGLVYVDDGDPAVDAYPANGATTEAWVASHELDLSNGWSDEEEA